MRVDESRLPTLLVRTCHLPALLRNSLPFLYHWTHGAGLPLTLQSSRMRRVGRARATPSMLFGLGLSLPPFAVGLACSRFDPLTVVELTSSTWGARAAQ